MLKRARVPRALLAAAILAVALVGLLGAWFASGWREVRAHQREVAAAPTLAAEQRGDELARELRGQLERLLAREGERPYFHYQNVFHDPKSSTSWSEAPSPLAALPDNPLVLGYFQLDAHGRATTPTLDDDVPELSEPTQLAAHRAFRDEVRRALAGPLAPAAVPVAAPAPVVAVKAPDARVFQFDGNSYAQNSVGNAYYRQQQNAPAPVAPAAAQSTAVTITVSALAWRTLAFAGAPTLVAAREVATPDGGLAQGFVVDRAALASWLTAHAAGLDASVRAGDGDGGRRAVAPGWELAVAANPAVVAAATADAAHLARDFAITFAIAGVIALIAGAFVVIVVVRAERLARERSQFAAAAAHELRTPLAGLQLYGDMLADGLGDPAKAGDYARRMSEEAARLGRVVSNVLGFSQLERGNLSVHAAAGDLGAALRELAERARPALERAGATLDLALADDAELRARFDPDALARILGNLLDNAEKYARGADDRRIELATATRGDVIEVVVTDRGPGIASAAHLFRPFARGVGTDAPAGLGLGLALSRSLAHAMGGDLVYRTGARGGAAFALVLPAA